MLGNDSEVGRKTMPRLVQVLYAGALVCGIQYLMRYDPAFSWAPASQVIIPAKPILASDTALPTNTQNKSQAIVPTILETVLMSNSSHAVDGPSEALQGTRTTPTTPHNQTGAQSVTPLVPTILETVLMSNSSHAVDGPSGALHGTPTTPTTPHNQTEAQSETPLDRFAELTSQLLAEADTDILRQALTNSKSADRSVRQFRASAGEKARQLVQKARRGETVTIVADGGSVTAGGGSIPESKRFYSVFARWFADSFAGPNATNVQVFGCGHGGRSSIYSTLFQDACFPEHPDIVIVDYSINDPHEAQYRVDIMHNWMRLYARKIDSIPSKPLVLFTYLWDQRVVKFKKLFQTAYINTGPRQLAGLSDRFLGSANLGRFLSYFVPGRDMDNFRPTFLADYHHPDATSHQVLGYLLVNLFASALSDRLPNVHQAESSMLPLLTNCTIPNADRARDIRNLIGHVQNPKLVSSAGFSFHKPRFGMENVRIRFANGTTLRVSERIMRGSPRHRHDSRYAAIVPLCSSESKLVFNFEMQAVRARVIVVGTEQSAELYQMFVDDRQVTAREINDVMGTSCGLDYRGVTRTWVQLQRRQTVTEVSFCQMEKGVHVLIDSLALL